MPIEPTVLEKQAAGLDLDALASTDEAIGHLRAAESALLQEERQHVPHVGIASQHKLVAYAEIITLLGDARGEIIARLTATARVTGLVGYAAPGSRLEITGPEGLLRQFRVDLVRGDNGRRVSQALRTDYGEAILAAGRLEVPGLPVVDRVGEVT